MTDKIEFTSNYSDLSTDRGFQFEFSCDRCGTGFRTRFKPFGASTVAGVLDTASSLFGGVFGQAADIGERVRSAGWQKAHDSAFVDAVEELRPDFVQCPRCSSWVCRRSCWNNRRGLCKECAPDVGVEMAAAQAEKTKQQVWEKAEVAEEDAKRLGKKEWKETHRATCPECGKPIDVNAKFCPECGAKIQKAAFCSECGAKVPAGAKFCPECGAKTAR
jgi:DNA-directed RNA polymerase subunit M/transcription elongation factor TFIIS